MRLFFAGGLIVVIIAGWLPFVRYGLYGESLLRPLVPNTYGLGGMEIGTAHLDGLITIHPILLLDHPYNDNFNDASGRQYFWDYLLRSALFGEWNHGDRLRPYAVLLLVQSLLLLPLLAVGLFRLFHKRDPLFVPLAALLVLLLLGAIAYRIVYAFSCAQDFRFVVPLVLPVTFFVVRGIEELPRSWRDAARGMYVLFLVYSLIFVMFLLLPFSRSWGS